jgi:hypothetical protein
MEAELGLYKQEKFRGFKLHATVNQQDLPLSAIIRSGQYLRPCNKFEGRFFPEIVENLEEITFWQMGLIIQNKILRWSEIRALRRSLLIILVRRKKAAKLNQMSF